LAARGVVDSGGQDCLVSFAERFSFRGVESGCGIIIRLTRLTDTSLIVHWMTEKSGLIKTVAKGARRPKSAFAGRVDLFVEAEFQWSRSSKSELHGLREIVVSDYRENLRKTYRDSSMAAYFGQLLELVLELDHPEPEMFDLLKRGLGYLGESGADRRALAFFEKEVVRLLGLGTGGMARIQQAYGKLPASREHCLALLQ
jgi:DNA repair protein RecO (recombination protein O)